jgi:hypothetical protein
MMRSVEAWLSCVIIGFSLFYWLVPSEVFLRFHSIRIADGYIYKVREVPWGQVTATWTEKITTPAGKVCPETGASGTSTYEDRRALDGALDEVHYELGGMAECAVPGAIYQSEHRVILGGWLPLRPVRVAYRLP